MKTNIVVATCVGAVVLTGLAPTAASAASRRTESIPLQGSSARTFGLLRATVRFRPGTSASRPRVATSPAWSQPGTYAVVALRHAPARQAAIFAFVANQQNPPPSQSSARLTFRSAFRSSTVVGDPMALSSGFSTSTLCRGLPKGVLSARSFAVLASGGAPLGSLSPADQVAQGLNIACKRSGASALRAALAAS